MSWLIIAVGLVSIGLGAAFFTKTAGVIFLFLGLIIAFIWYSKYGKRKQKL